MSTPISRSISHSLRRSIKSHRRCVCNAQTQRCQPPILRRGQHSVASNSHFPRLAQSSLWETIFPKSLRQKTKEIVRPTQKKPLNPASYFIWIYLLIGSQAIRILGVKNESDVYMRRADLQIAKLREVIEKLQRGEPVDIPQALGTGDEDEEREWENALREIEREEREWQQSRKDKEEEAKRREGEKSKVEMLRQDASPMNNESLADSRSNDTAQPPTTPGFY